MTKLKTAIIGLGRMGAEPSDRLYSTLPNGWTPITHAESIISTPTLELISLCDVDIAKTEKFGKLYSIEKCYNNYNELFDVEKPDVISIATRTDVKTEIIKNKC